MGTEYRFGAGKMTADCYWCKHSQMRHGSLHCSLDDINLEISQKSTREIAERCPYYKFDSLRYAVKKMTHLKSRWSQARPQL